MEINIIKYFCFSEIPNVKNIFAKIKTLRTVCIYHVSCTNQLYISLKIKIMFLYNNAQIY